MASSADRADGVPEPDKDLRAITRRIGGELDYRYVESLPETQTRAMTKAWTMGASYMEIADEWNTTTAVARLAVERTLADSLDDFEDRAKQRNRLNMWLNAAMKAVSPRALDPKDKQQANYLRLGLEVSARIAGLNGLNAPQEHIIHAPSGDELQQFVDAVARLNGVIPPVEGDPFELVEVDGVWEEEKDDLEG